jgi:FkbM family methyltransferase
MSLLNVLRFVADHPLNRGDKLASLLRFARWQLGMRLISGAVAFEWMHGARFLVKRGETGLTGNVYAGLQEFADMAFVLHVLRHDDLFVDVGANAGSYTILAGSVIGSSGWAFEPVPSTYRRLMDNVLLNRLETRVRCLNIGIGRKQDKISFTADADTVNHALAEGEDCSNTVDVEILTLDALLTISRPCLIKIDVEGFETPVLEGASAVLRSPALHSVIMELNGSGQRYGYDDDKILETMSEFGFRTYSYEPFSRTLVDLHGQHLTEGNTLFVRDAAFVTDRIRSSLRFKVRGREL